MAKHVLSHHFSEPLEGATTAKVDISAGDGNLTIDQLPAGRQELAGGMLQYFEKQGLPTRTLVSSNGQAALTLKGDPAGRPWFRFPWTACKGAYEWQIHLNPTVTSDITAHSNGGNVKLNLAGMEVTRLTADTGGGNMDVVLPDKAANVGVIVRTGAGNVTVEIGNGITGSSSINANSGAGNVTVCIPKDVAARIHTTTGMGKVIIDPRFNQTDKNTYQSPDYEDAVNKVEITTSSGAGNVNATTRN
jgi:hypothetical protein